MCVSTKKNCKKVIFYLGFAALFDVPLELVDDFVLFLVAFVLDLNRLHVRTILGFFQLFLKVKFVLFI